MDDWLAEIADRTAGKTLTQLLAAHPMLDGLIMGLAEGSRYLWELVRADPARLVWLLEGEPELRFIAIFGTSVQGKRQFAGRATQRFVSQPALLEQTSHRSNRDFATVIVTATRESEHPVRALSRIVENLFQLRLRKNQVSSKRYTG